MDYLQYFSPLLLSACQQAFPQLASDEISSLISFEVPRHHDHGDISSNLAMNLARRLKISPMAIAEKIAAQFSQNNIHEKSPVAKTEAVSPGFINFFLNEEFWAKIIADINSIQYCDYAKSDIGQGTKINIEFVSANPTGPMHIGHARGAVYGDVLSKILKNCGYDITKEFYINDAGNQINHLVQSLWIRYQQLCGIDVEMPENSYPGEYIIEVAGKLRQIYQNSLLSSNSSKQNHSDSSATSNPISKDISKNTSECLEKKYNILRDFIIKEMLQEIKNDLSALGVKHDVFTSEAEDIIKNGEIEKAVTVLEKKQLLYKGILDRPKGENDADWEPRKQLLFKSTQFGDSSDRAIRKNDGSPSYFLSDVAYHNQKISRNFQRLILLLGADHIGYISRLKAAVAALSDGIIELEVVVIEMVNLVDNGKRVKMSKRSGNFLTLREVLENLGRGILRFTMLWRKSDTQFELDFSKAKEMSKDNPIFYIQYAHTRIVSTIKKAISNGYCEEDEFLISYINSFPNLSSNIQINEERNGLYSQNFSSPEQFINYNLNLVTPIDYTKIIGFAKKLVHKTAQLQRTIEIAATTLEPHRLSYYLHELAAELHGVWNLGMDEPEMRILVSDKQISRARLGVLFAVAKTIGKGLELMGIEPMMEM